MSLQGGDFGFGVLETVFAQLSFQRKCTIVPYQRKRTRGDDEGRIPPLGMATGGWKEGDREEVTPPLLPRSSTTWGLLCPLPSLRPEVGNGRWGRRRCTHRKWLQTLRVFSCPPPTPLPCPLPDIPPPHPTPAAGPAFLVMWQERHQLGPRGHGTAHEQKPREGGRGSPLCPAVWRPR